MLYLSENGMVYGGDRQQREDGSFDPELPDRPSPEYQWNGSDWMLEAPENYIGLYDALLADGLSVFLFVRSLSDQNLPVANAYGDFVNALTTPAPSLPALQSCINNLFAAIQGFGQGFSTAQIATMRSLLDKNGFMAIAFPMSQG